MSNLFNDLDLETVLQCPVCLEIPPNLIYLCKVGHHMCDKCKVRLTLCPTCQSPMTKSRNFLAEALISKLEVLRVSSSSFYIGLETFSIVYGTYICSSMKTNFKA